MLFLTVSLVLYSQCVLAFELRLDDRTYRSKELENNIYAFYGIPYGRQPVGRFRLTKTEPLSSMSSWNLNPEEKRLYESKRSEPQSCPQIDPFGTTIDARSSEDCLRVDLYVKKDLYDRAYSKPGAMAILLDGFDFKSSIAHRIDPQLSFLTSYFSDSSVSILAVIHSRNGALGFLTTEDENVPANLGLWDQHVALSFLRQNAATLKIDTERISILAFGSGAISTSIHMINGRNRNAFQAAVISGGTALSPDVNIPFARERAFKFAQSLGCSSSSSSKLLQCLRETDLTKLVRMAASPQFQFGPIVDGNHTYDLEDSYIPELPQTLMESASFDQIRGVIYGYAENAGSYRYYTAKGELEEREMETIDSKIRKYLMPYQRYADTATAITAAAKFVYFRNYTDEQIEANTTLFDELMCKALTDYLSYSPIMTAARTHAARKTSGVYVYVRMAETGMPTLSDRLPSMKTAAIKYATSMDDMLQFVGIEGIDNGRNDQQLRNNWQNAFRDSLLSGSGAQQQVANIYQYDWKTSRNQITPTRNTGMGQTINGLYRVAERVFWSKFVPNIQTTLDEISLKSTERHVASQTYRLATWSTTAVIIVLLVLIAILAVLLWKLHRDTTAMPNVAFRKVAQSEA